MKQPSEDEKLLRLYERLTNDETGDPGRDADIVEVIRQCQEAPTAKDAVRVLEEHGWNSCEDGRDQRQTLERYARGFRHAGRKRKRAREGKPTGAWASDGIARGFGRDVAKLIGD